MSVLLTDDDKNLIIQVFEDLKGQLPWYEQGAITADLEDQLASAIIDKLNDAHTNPLPKGYSYK